jgi:L,D-peptidoglycan transpeptidase YkuD (ErfK/YbiS/YcfS/YnhG family)
MIFKRHRGCYLIAGWIAGAVIMGAMPSPGAAVAIKPFRQSTQMIVVTTPGWNAVQGRMQAYERDTPQASWRPVGKSIAIVVGVHGMGWGLGEVPTEGSGIRRPGDPVKKEGDGRSPAGVFALGAAFGDALQPLPGIKLAYLPLTPSIECVDDVHSNFYNRVVDRSTVAADWNSSEHMRDVGEAYRWGVVVGQNGGSQQAEADSPVRGAGSCVFLHIWGGPAHGTAGCTAMSQDELETLLVWLDPARKPLLVQLPESAYKRLTKRWALPRG